MVSPRLRTRSRLPQMEWTDSWTVANPPRGGGDSLVPQTMRDNPLLSPTSRSALPSYAYNTKFNAGAVSDWLETTAALDSSDSSLDGNALEHHDSTEVDAGTPGTDNAAAETRRRNSLGLALDLRDLKSIILSNSFSNEKAPPDSRPYPSPVSPATTLFLRSNVSPATSSATSEADSYFDYQRPRQLSSATSVQTSNYGPNDDDDYCKAERALPPSPDLVPLSLPPIQDALPELPPAPAVAPSPSHPLHRAHRLSMTPVGTAPPPSLVEMSSSPESTTTQPPPRIRKNSIVDLPPVSVSSSAAETGLHPLPPTPPRSPRAHLRMMPLPVPSPQTVEALPPPQLVSPATPAIRPLAAAAELIPQSSKRQRRS